MGIPIEILDLAHRETFYQCKVQSENDVPCFLNCILDNLEASVPQITVLMCGRGIFRALESSSSQSKDSCNDLFVHRRTSRRRL